MNQSSAHQWLQNEPLYDTVIALVRMVRQYQIFVLIDTKSSKIG